MVKVVYNAMKVSSAVVSILHLRSEAYALVICSTTITGGFIFGMDVT